jgi:hypothetical protein
MPTSVGMTDGVNRRVGMTDGVNRSVGMTDGVNRRVGITASWYQSSAGGVVITKNTRSFRPVL